MSLNRGTKRQRHRRLCIYIGAALLIWGLAMLFVGKQGLINADATIAQEGMAAIRALLIGGVVMSIGAIGLMAYVIKSSYSDFQ